MKLKSYTEMMNEARAPATKRMVAEAEELGADGIVNIRYASSAIMQGAAEFLPLLRANSSNFLLISFAA